MKIIIITALLALLCAGCATRITPMGKDTYFVAYKGSAFATAGSAKAKCYKMANDFCAKRGLVMVPQSVSAKETAPFSPATAELTFRALSKDDPEYQRPNMVNAPNEILEIRKGQTP